MGDIPFEDVIIHSTVLAPRRAAHVEEPRHRHRPARRRSPSHGADATRYGLLKMSSTQDVRFSYGAIEEGRKLANKLWNVARLICSNAGAGDAVELRPASARGALDPRAPRRDAAREFEDDLARVRLLAGRATRSTTSPSTTSATGTRRRSSRGCTTATRMRRRPRSRALERLLQAAAPGDAARDRGDLVAPARPRDAADRRAVARAGRRASPPTRRARPRAGGGRRSSGAAACWSSSRATSSGSSTAVVRPERVQANGERRRPSASGCARRSRAPRGCSRNERFVANAPAEVVEARAREARALPPRARCARRLTTSPGSSRSRRGRRSSGSSGCAQLLARARRPAARVPRRSTSSARTASRRRRGCRGAARGRGPARRRVHARRTSRLARADPGARRRRPTSRPRSPACARRPSAVGATQFEALTAAALAEFAAAGVDAAVVEAGLGGRLDATNVLDAPVVVLTNVALEHTDVLGDDARGDRRARSWPSSRRARPSSSASPSGRSSPQAGARGVVVDGPEQPRARGRGGGDVPRQPVDRAAAEDAVAPGPAGARSATRRSRSGTARTTSAASARCSRGSRRAATSSSPRSSRDKDADGMLAALSALGDTLVATASTNARALAADELAATRRPLLRPRGDRRRSRRGRRRARALAGARRRGPGHGLALPARGSAAVRPQTPYHEQRRTSG